MQRRRFLQSSLAAAVSSALPLSPALASLKYVPTKVSADIHAVAGDGQAITLAAADVQDFSNQLKSHLLLPGIEGYDEARMLLNPSFDKRPALIAQPTGVADVQSAVNFAREHKLLVAVKCGGHSASGKSTCDGGLQIDLSNFHGVRVDPKARTARVDGGSLLGELDHESMAHGLVTTAGTVSHTGVGGLTLGGGFGRLGRRFGMTIDNLLEMDVVTPDGELRRAAKDENPDLYWALRGGGGNFGIVTSFLFRLHPMQREVVRARFSYPQAQARQVLRFFGEYAQQIPDDMELNAGMFAPPGGAPPSVSLNVVFSGDAGRLERLLAPIRKAGKTSREQVSTLDYVALQRSGDFDDPRANGSYQKSGFIGAIDSGMVDAMVDNFDPKPNRVTWFSFQQSGGAISRIAPEATAFAHREASHNMLSFVAWKFGDDPTEHVRDIKRYWSNIEPYTRGFYSNDVFDESQQQINANYRQNFPRLLEIKKKYDPGNLFRLNANIAPG